MSPPHLGIVTSFCGFFCGRLCACVRVFTCVFANVFPPTVEEIADLPVSHTVVLGFQGFFKALGSRASRADTHIRTDSSFLAVWVKGLFTSDIRSKAGPGTMSFTGQQRLQLLAVIMRKGAEGHSFVTYTPRNTYNRNICPSAS